MGFRNPLVIGSNPSFIISLQGSCYLPHGKKPDSFKLQIEIVEARAKDPEGRVYVSLFFPSPHWIADYGLVVGVRSLEGDPSHYGIPPTTYSTSVSLIEVIAAVVGNYDDGVDEYQFMLGYLRNDKYLFLKRFMPLK
ncbi:hypothetical protein QCA50_014422 [Cerrena zonata]|uniref:Uncharacterized protein n=1 Tax=Cerrena zonata TaxID=2478898 RepID=A0AAW0FTJ6_9APHY